MILTFVMTLRRCSAGVALVSMLFALSMVAIAQDHFAAASIEKNRQGNSPTFITFKKGDQPTVASFFGEYRNAYSFSSDNEMKPAKIFTDELRERHHRFKQYYKGIEVLGSEYILHEKNGLVNSANGVLVSGINIDVAPSISNDEALRRALEYVGASQYMLEDPQEEAFLQKERKNRLATYYPVGSLKITSGKFELAASNLKLVYRFEIYTKRPFGGFFIDVDANTGELVNKLPRIYEVNATGTGSSLYNGTVNITVDNFASGQYRLRETLRSGVVTRDLQNGSTIPGAVDFVSASPNFTATNSRAGVSVHWAAEQTYDYYLNRFARNSYNGIGGEIRTYVHLQTNLNNAFWYPTLQSLLFGDGDGITFSPLVSLDIVAHEFTHGVTENEANLVYAYEPGALNESFSDIFGTAVEFFAQGQGDWLCGEDVTLPAHDGLRSMSNPNVHDDPDTYLGTHWWTSDDDNGGVHTNSGVQNFWFYLLSQGGAGTNDNGCAYSVSGIGINKAAAIAYRNLTVYLTPTSNHIDARTGAVAAAGDLYGNGSNEQQQVMKAWSAVGVGPCVSLLPNLIANAEFDLGTANWTKYSPLATDINFTTEPNGPSGSYAKLHINRISNNMQLYQPYFQLVAGKRYRLSFEAKSPTGRKVHVAVMKHNYNPPVPPAFYGFNKDIQLSANWQHYEYQFGAGGFRGTTNDTRLRFYFVYMCQAGDDYYFDKIELQQIVAKEGETEELTVPTSYVLDQNFPNPFNPSTNISFAIPQDGRVSLKVFDLLGREVATLVNELRSGGSYTETFDASNLASGIYFYRLESGSFVQSKKMIIMK